MQRGPKIHGVATPAPCRLAASLHSFQKTGASPNRMAVCSVWKNLFTPIEYHLRLLWIFFGPLVFYALRPPHRRGFPETWVCGWRGFKKSPLRSTCSSPWGRRGDCGLCVSKRDGSNIPALHHIGVDNFFPSATNPLV